MKNITTRKRFRIHSDQISLVLVIQKVKSADGLDKPLFLWSQVPLGYSQVSCRQYVQDCVTSSNP